MTSTTAGERQRLADWARDEMSDVPWSRDAVQAGDTITWHTRNGGHLASGQVQFATRDAVHVIVPSRGIYPVEWARVETHQRTT